MSITHEDIMDLRTLADRWRELLAQDAEDYEDDRDADLAAYADLAAELGCDADPEALAYQGDMYDPTLIADEYFVKYAEELADDIGAVNSEASWPNNHIDWEAAAEELRVDYSSVTFDGHDYLIRL